MTKKTILVTGATGFLGKNLEKRFLENFSDTVVFTARVGDSQRNVHSLDLTKADTVLDFISNIKPTHVIHLGAQVDLTRNFEVARHTMEVNLVGTSNLLMALALLPPKQFILASTEEVYGQGPIPYKEDSETHPPSPYAISKIGSENMCRIWANKYGFDATVFRIGTMYGPFQPKHRYIHQTITNALQNRDIPINSGKKKRDYVYVGDVIDAIQLVLEKDSHYGFQVINLGGGTTITLLALVKDIVKICHSTSRLQIGILPDRISEAEEWLLDNSKAKKILDWKPKTDIKTGLKATIEDIESNSRYGY